ncbi:hypothetical protein [Indiicoccus explosivorum]|uniref:hypothetical protein n=1 Tax=Indiicoccus explosivorum TaxID=1917864 RepID=UPI000B45482B|nr:hypothetical protein [Indiicoccus explosivorum]
MKKVLIISYYYAPANIMGAVRASKLSKYLAKEGMDVTVICSRDNKLLFMPETIKGDEIIIPDTALIRKIIIDHSRNYKRLASFLGRFASRISSNSSSSSPKVEDSAQTYRPSFKKKLIHFITFSASLIQDADFCLQARKK